MKKSLRNYRLFFHRMGLLFLFIPLIVLILSIVLPDRGFSEKENRVLSSLPHLNGSQIASGGFEKQFETYENDQFPLRDLWITLKAGTDRLMGKVESNGVYVGKSGYLMEEFKAPDQTQYDATVKAMTDFAQKHSDLKQYALIAPNSVNILSDRLPAFAPVQDQSIVFIHHPFIFRQEFLFLSKEINYLGLMSKIRSFITSTLYLPTVFLVAII